MFSNCPFVFNNYERVFYYSIIFASLLQYQNIVLYYWNVTNKPDSGGTSGCKIILQSHTNQSDDAFKIPNNSDWTDLFWFCGLVGLFNILVGLPTCAFAISTMSLFLLHIILCFRIDEVALIKELSPKFCHKLCCRFVAMYTISLELPRSNSFWRDHQLFGPPSRDPKLHEVVVQGCSSLS